MQRKFRTVAALCAVTMTALGAGVVGAADTFKATDNQYNVSSYEFSSVAYNNGDPAQTYRHIVTKHNGVVDTNVITVNGDIQWDKDDQGHYVNGYMNGVKVKDGNVTANNVAAKNVQASTANVGNLYANRVSGVQTDEKDKSSAVSVEYLEQKIAELQAEIDALKHK